jgi:hypothetical protein
MSATSTTGGASAAGAVGSTSIFSTICPFRAVCGRSWAALREAEAEENVYSPPFFLFLAFFERGELEPGYCTAHEYVPFQDPSSFAIYPRAQIGPDDGPHTAPSVAVNGVFDRLSLSHIQVADGAEQFRLGGERRRRRLSVEV